MSRALLIQRSIVPAAERAEYLRRLRDKREHYALVNCRFWAFEEAGLPGAFLEFIEGPDPGALAAAQSAAPEPPRDPGRMYREVELT